MNVSHFVFLMMLAVYSTAHAKTPKAELKKPKVVNPGSGACKFPWAKRIQQENSVQILYEFLDKDGKPLPPAAMA